MFKKIEIWIVLLVLLFFLICAILYGALLRHHYINGKEFPKLQKIALFFAEIPSNTKTIFGMDDMNKPDVRLKNFNLPKFKRFIETKRNALLILPRYDEDLERSVVEIININTFEVLHTYKHDITAMNNLIDISSKQVPQVPLR